MPNLHKAKETASYKKDTVKRLVDLIKKYPIIGSLNMENLPAAQLQRMRAQLRDKVEMFMTKKRFMKIAIEKVKAEKKGFEKIEETLSGMPALLFTNENPFALFRTLKKRKSKAPAKPGQTAPSDIVVKAGPTSFAPGPVIGELGALGIKTKVDAGKITILEDSVVCKEGEEISAPLAGMLARLGIEPMEVGLDLVAVYEDGDIFTKSVLDIDDEKFMADLMQAAKWAFNISCETAYLTEMNKELLLQKAFLDSKALALSQNIPADAVVEELLAKAERGMQSLKSQLPEMPEAKAEGEKAEEKKEEVKAETKPAEEAPKEEPKAEEKPAEQPKEEVKEKKAEEKAETPEPEKKVEEKQKKEEIQPEEVKEEKAPEQKPEANAEEKKEEKPEEEKKPAKEKTEAEKTAERIIEQAKIMEEGAKTAEKIVEEVKEEAEKEEKEKEPEAKKQKKKEKDDEMEKVEELAQELLKKGTLRK